VSYGYDDSHQLTSITQGTSVVGFTYDDAGRRATLTYPNGIVAAYGYDAANRLTSLTYTGPNGLLGDLAYTYDAAGNRTSIGGTWARTGLPQAVPSATYDAANRIMTWNGTAFGYDLNGNLTSDGLTSYGWNARDQLVGLSGGTSASFVYDSVGRRRSKTIAGTTTNFLYDGMNFVQEQASGGAPTANLLTGLGIDETFTRIDATGTGALLHDGLNSTLEIADGSGTLQTHYTYDPFGGTTVAGVSTNAQQFTGRENDGARLYYYRARYYDEALGRFISEDPIGHLGGINIYTYTLDNPVSYIDAFGLDVTIIAYPGAAYHGIQNPGGHLGVSINGSPAVGFNPAPGWDPAAIAGANVPGEALPVDPSSPIDNRSVGGSCRVTIRTTAAQDQAMLDYIRNRTNSPGNYQLFGRNCAEFGGDVLRAGGVNAPWTPLPRNLVNDLIRMYPTTPWSYSGLPPGWGGQ
jgi:RHS repeat-associated protein